MSRLYGALSRRVFTHLYPRWPWVEVPVTHVTNGVHVPSSDSRWADHVWTEACGKARWRGAMEVARAVQILDPEALTLGFALRFAGYKRPNLLLHDPDRLGRLLTARRRRVRRPRT